MVSSKEVKVNQRFKYDGETWVCTSNDGFIFSAENVNENSNRHDFMFIGMGEDVELISQ